MSRKQHVVIGNSAAALNTIKSIRQFDRCGSIVLISGERCNAYSPVLLTYYLKGTISRESLFIVDESFYLANGVKRVLGNKVMAVDPSRQRILLADADEMKYDKLLIATGASPIFPGIPSEGLKYVMSLRTIDDAERILRCAKEAKEVIVIGGGLVALQLLDALFRRDIKYTVLISSKHLLSQSIGADCARIVQTELESYGIRFVFDTNVKQIKREGQKTIVVTDSNEELTAHMVIAGKGVRPNTELVANTGINTNVGILVDRMMRTSVSNVFAAGDVSEGQNFLTGREEIFPNWASACRQGKIAGANMAGCGKEYAGGFKSFITTVFGLTIASIGLSATSDGMDVTEYRFYDPRRKTCTEIRFADNKLVGATLLGKTASAGMLMNFIRNRKEISSCKEEMARTSFDFTKFLPAKARYF